MAATGTPTPNIGLRRAQGTDPASVDDINYNSALIDTKLGAVGNSSVQDQIDTLNSNLGMSTYLASNTLDELKSSLLTIAGTIPVNGRIGIQFSVNSSYISDIGLPEGGTYQGFLERISTYDQGYFSANLAENNGNTLLITYSNGTWKFNSLTSNKAAFESISETSYAHTEVTGYADAVSKLPSEFFGVAKITFKSNYVATALVSKTSNSDCTMLVTFDAGISPRHFIHVNGQNTLAVLAYNS